MDLFECLVFRAMTDTFTDNKFDATKVVGSAPVALTEKLSLENGESDDLGIYVRYNARPGDTLICKG